MSTATVKSKIESSDCDSELADIRALVADDMNAVNALIRQRLRSNVVLINQLGQYIVGSGGKRLRPTLLLLAARACGYASEQHINLAAIVEFIHTATLLHDDVVDASQMRRGRQTSNAIWGNEASVLVGDFLYSRAFEMMVEVGDMRVMEILARTTNVIAEGEVLQLLNCHDPETTEARYMEVIRSKTAKLFSAAAQLGAVLSGLSRETEDALASYGTHLGTAFQLIDDVLDYDGASEEIGKNVGDDLSEGKPTLPLIHVMHRGSPEQARLIRHAIEHGGSEQINEVVAAVQETGALLYAQNVARKEADFAVNCLRSVPGSASRDALIRLAHFAVDRNH